MKLISNIEDLIKKSGLRDEIFRNALGISQAQLRNIKKGESFPTVPKVFILARMLNCKVDELYEVINEEEL